MPTAGALRFCDKLGGNRGKYVKPYYEKPLAFLRRQEYETRKKTVIEYLSARLSPHGIPPVPSMIFLSAF
jgi:hypothetical protein